MNLAAASTQALWSDCPPDVLARCFSSQLDHTDNCAAACACKAWHDAFRTCTSELHFFSNPLNTGRFPSGYMRQFSNLSKVHLAKSADWQSHSRTWLTVQERKVSWNREELAWAEEILASLPESCCQLTLDHFLTYRSHRHSPFSQLGSLRKLYIRGLERPTFHLDVVSCLQHLQVLSLVGTAEVRLKFQGSLANLPASLIWLQLQGLYTYAPLNMAELIEGRQLQHLSISITPVAFGTAALEADSDVEDALPSSAQDDIRVWSQATSLTSLELRDTSVSSGRLAAAVLRNTPKLEELILCNVSFARELFVLTLGDLLQAPSLQALDITNSLNIMMSQQDFSGSGAQLHSFGFHYNSLNAGVEATSLQALMRPAQKADHVVTRPVLKVEGQFPHFGYQHWVNTLPLTVLTHLTIADAHKWPVALFLNGQGNALSNLEFLDVSFASLVSSDMDGIMFHADSHLKELYISGTTCTSVNLSACSSLVSLGIIHRGHEAPSTDLPMSLQKLYLHSVLRQDSENVLVTLTNLTHLQLGGRAATKGAMKALPQLHEKLLHLNLWDGCVTALQRLSTLTNLKRLTMPLPPSNEQLTAIKQLRQLRHIEVTTHQGMHTPRGKVVPPWSVKHPW